MIEIPYAVYPEMTVNCFNVLYIHCFLENLTLTPFCELLVHVLGLFSDFSLSLHYWFNNMSICYVPKHCAKFVTCVISFNQH